MAFTQTKKQFRRGGQAAPHRERTNVQIKDFLGLNKLQADNKLKLGELLEATNVRFGEGYVEKAPGYVTVADQTSTVTGGISMVDVFTSKANAETIMVYFPTLGDLYRVNGTGLTSVVTTLTPGAMTDVQAGASYQDAYYFVNGKDALQKITSAFVVSVPALAPIHADTSIVKLTGIIYYLDRLYGWGDPDYPYRLYFSASGNPDDWRTTGDAGFLDLPGNIISVAEGAASLFFSTSQVNGEIVASNDNLPIPRTIESSSPASSQRAFTQVKNATLYLTEQGLKNIGQIERLPRGSFENDLSRIIRPDFLPERMVKTRAASVYSKNEHTLLTAVRTAGGTGVNDAILCYDDELGRYSYDYGISTYDFATTRDGSVYWGDPTQAKVYKRSVINQASKANYSNGGSAIPFSVTTGWIAPSGPDITQLLRNMYFYFRVDTGTRIDITLSFDYSRSASFNFTLVPPDGVTSAHVWAAPLFGDYSWGGQGQTLNGVFRYFQRQVPNRQWFNFIKVNVRNDEDQRFVRLEGIRIETIPRPARHYGRPSVTSDILSPTSTP